MSALSILENRKNNFYLTKFYNEFISKLKESNASVNKIDSSIYTLDRILETRKVVGQESFNKFKKNNSVLLDNICDLLFALTENDYYDKSFQESKKRIQSNNIEKILEPLIKHYVYNLPSKKEDLSILVNIEKNKIQYNFNVEIIPSISLNTIIHENNIFESSIINKQINLKEKFIEILETYHDWTYSKIEKIAKDFNTHVDNPLLLETTHNVLKKTKIKFYATDFISEENLHKALNKTKSHSLNKIRLDFQFNLLKNKLDQHKIKTYKEYFPEARNRKRKITFYCGPTNSGKTYNAFELLKECNSGAYLAPLRLLALEGLEEIEKRGKICSLLTGEEQLIKPNSNFISSTVELVNTSKEYDIAIVDEVQMLSDSERGWAWTQAIIGVNAKHLILVGSTEALNQVKFLAEYMNEPLEIKEFERKLPLHVNEQHIDETKIAKINNRSAVVCFSKKEVYKYKQILENNGRKVSVIYGALSPTVRKEEARRFRTGETDILVSTDAIGMGLNLPIEEIVLTKTNKYNGKEDTKVSPSLIKQICGRSGRFSYGKEGLVSALNKRSIDYIKQCLEMKIENDLVFYIKPNDLILSDLMPQMKNKIYNTLKYYKENFSHNESSFINCVTEETMEKALFIDSANLIKDGDLSIKEVINLLQSPVSCSDGFAIYANNIVKRKKLSIAERKQEDNKLIKNNINRNNIDFLEKEIRKVNIYLWLSTHFEDLFVNTNDLLFYREYLEDLFIEYLKEQTKKVKLIKN